MVDTKVERKRAGFPCCYLPRHIVAQRNAAGEAMVFRCLTCNRCVDVEGFVVELSEGGSDVDFAQ